MKQIITFICGLLLLSASAAAQCDKRWRDNYTNTFTTCNNPITFYSTSTYWKDFSAIQGSCDICVLGSPGFAAEKPLQKTYIFDIVRLEPGGGETVVGTISKGNLKIKFPDDFQPFLSSMTNGEYRIRLSVNVRWQWDTPHDPSYEAKLNGTVIKFVPNLEANAASRNFTLNIGNIDCFNYFKCFSAYLSVPAIQQYGAPTKVTAVTNPAGSYTYYWIVGITTNEANGCVKGSSPYPPTSQNYIIVPCSPCDMYVQCGIVDNNNPNCVVNTYLYLGRRGCIEKDTIKFPPPSDGRMSLQPQAARSAAAEVSIKNLPGRQLVAEGLPADVTSTIRVVDYSGVVRQQWTVKNSTARLQVTAAEAEKPYVIVVESAGKTLARKSIVLQ